MSENSVYVGIDSHELNQVRRVLGKIEAWRSSQLDAKFMEGEVFALLLAPERITSITKFTSAFGRFLANSNELRLLEMILKGLVQSYTIFRWNATVGQKMLGIGYEPSTAIQRIIFITLEYIFPYIISRAQKQSDLCVFTKYEYCLKILLRAGDLLCLVRFLRNGKWLGVSEWISGMKIQRHRIGAYGLSFDYVKRMVLIEVAEQVVLNAIRLYRSVNWSNTQLHLTKGHSDGRCENCGAEKGCLMMRGYPCNHMICYWCCFVGGKSGAMGRKCCKIVEKYERVS